VQIGEWNKIQIVQTQTLLIYFKIEKLAGRAVDLWKVRGTVSRAKFRHFSKLASLHLHFSHLPAIYYA
jgi:hypothetical protein